MLENIKVRPALYFWEKTIAGLYYFLDDLAIGAVYSESCLLRIRL